MGAEIFQKFWFDTITVYVHIYLITYTFIQLPHALAPSLHPILKTTMNVLFGKMQSSAIALVLMSFTVSKLLPLIGSPYIIFITVIRMV